MSFRDIRKYLEGQTFPCGPVPHVVYELNLLVPFVCARPPIWKPNIVIPVYYIEEY